MSIPITIRKPQGIAPRFDPNLKVGFARTAENADLTSGKLRAMADASLEVADTNLYNSMFYFAGAWERNTDRFYLEWKIGTYDILIYLVDGVPTKKIGSSTAILGQPRLAAPTAADNGGGALTDTFSYIITTTRSVGGFTEESGPSTASAEITVAAKKILVTAPTISDSDVTFWNIYRISNTSGEYQFAATVAVATTTYDDNNADTDLGASPTTWYTSDQGNTITWDKPQVTFDGMIAAEPYTGMLFFWKGSTLYWTEPGHPDAMPAFYNMNFPSDIQRVFPFAGTLAVLTKTGPHRVDGPHPELLQPSKVLGEEPCISTAAAKTTRGIAYLSDTGIVLFNLVDTAIMTDERFTEQWFADNVTAAGAFMEENDGKIYLFHSGGVLVMDARTRAVIFTTMDIVAYSSHVRPDTGELYYMDSAGVKKLAGGTGTLTWTWQSGDLVGRHPEDKDFEGIELIGSGVITATLYIDGTQVATKAMTFSQYRGRILKIDSDVNNGRAMQVKLTGTGQFDEIIARYSP